MTNKKNTSYVRTCLEWFQNNIILNNIPISLDWKESGHLFLTLSADETLASSVQLSLTADLRGLVCFVFPQESSEIANHFPIKKVWTTIHKEAIKIAIIGFTKCRFKWVNDFFKVTSNRIIQTTNVGMKSNKINVYIILRAKIYTYI